MASKTAEVNETDSTPLQCEGRSSSTESKSESSPERSDQLYEECHEIEPANPARELAPLRKDVLACLACIIKQDENPLKHLTFGAPQEDISISEDTLSQLADSWNLARCRLDKTFGMLSTCTKEFTKELDGDDRNEMFDDDSSVSLAVTEVVRSLKSIGHLLTNFVITENCGFQAIDGVLHHVTNNLRTRLGEYARENEKAYKDYTQRNAIFDPVFPILALDLDSQTEILNQLEKVTADVQRSSEHLRLALRRRDWQRQVVDNDKAVSRRSAAFHQYEGEPRHKGKEVRFGDHVVAGSDENHSAAENKAYHRVYTKPKKTRSRSLSNSSSHSLQGIDAMDEDNRLIPGVSSNRNDLPTRIVNTMTEIRQSITEIKKRWQHIKQDIDSADTPPSSPIALVLSTDPVALDYLETDRGGSENPPLENEGGASLPSMLEGLKINLSGDDLPQDIVSLLMEKVPAAENEIDRLFSLDYIKPLQKLYQARSLLEALPTWQVNMSKSHAQLAESIFNQVQGDLVNRILHSVSDISSKVSTRLNNGDVRLNLSPLVEALEGSFLQLQKIRFSTRLAPRWSDLHSDFTSVGTKYTSLSQYIRETSPQDVTSTGCNWKDIRLLPTVYFVIQVLREETGEVKPQRKKTLSTCPPMASVKSLLDGVVSNGDGSQELCPKAVDASNVTD